MLDPIESAALVVSIAALGLAVYEGRSTRHHNRLSVRPQLTLHHHLGGSKGRIGMSLLNSGLGPAQILRITICVAGLEIRGDTDKGWNLAIHELGLSELKPNVEVISGGFIQPGEGIWLFSWPHTPESRGVEQLHTSSPVSLRGGHVCLYVRGEGRSNLRHLQCGLTLPLSGSTPGYALRWQIMSNVRRRTRRSKWSSHVNFLSSTGYQQGRCA